MKYYYLDSEKKVKGPHSWAELKEMYDNGILNEETLAAAAGENGWKPLSDLLKENGDDCSTWNNSESVNSDLAPSGGLWWTFTTAIKKSFVYKGRASRKEFWGFFLFYYIFSLVIEYLSGLLVPAYVSSLFEHQMEQASAANDVDLAILALQGLCSEPMVILGTSIYWIYMILITFPFLSITVRRLHDTGRSAAPVIIGCIAHLAFVLSILYMCYTVVACTFDANSPHGFDQHLVAPIVLVAVSFLFLLVISVYLLVMMLLPGQCGTNKYGTERQ